MKLALTLLSPTVTTVTVHCIPLGQKRAVRVHLIVSLIVSLIVFLIVSLIAWGYQGGDFAPFNSLGLPFLHSDSLGLPGCT